VTNDGPDPSRLTLSENSPHFRLEFAANDGACDGFLSPGGSSLGPGRSCWLEVWFDPLSAGSRTTTLTVTSTPGGTRTWT
jgi:hypothetical protein